MTSLDLPSNSLSPLAWKLRLAEAETATRKRRGAAPPIWQPFPDSPQEQAYHSEADELFYGGAAGGGKTDLLLGLAGTAHRQSVIFRREFPRIRALIERSREIYNAKGDTHAKDSYNESLHIWRFADGRMVEFSAAQYEKDKENQRGRPRDFYAFDEITEFTESQYRFITAWNRSTVRGQRCRIVVTGNPPTSSEGQWVVDYWAAWLDPTHPNPAEPGELRWYVRIDDKQVEVESGEPVYLEGAIEPLLPRSRTFIPARLEDNPVLSATTYRATLMALDEPLRSQMLYGIFGLNADDDIWQAIPLAWVLAAEQRWRDMEPPQLRARAFGVDVARGGKDETVIAPLRGTYFDELKSYPGHSTPDGESVASKVLLDYEAGAEIAIDVIGVGSSPYDILKGKLPNVVTPINNGEGAPPGEVDASGKYGFLNFRAYSWWRFREALNPSSGEDIALPPDRKLRADLTAPRYKTTGGKYAIESKDDIKKRLGRSPDKGDAVVMAWIVCQLQRRIEVSNVLDSYYNYRG